MSDLRTEIVEAVYETCDKSRCMERKNMSDNPECVLVCPTVDKLHTLFIKTAKGIVPGKKQTIPYYETGNMDAVEFSKWANDEGYSAAIDDMNANFRDALRKLYEIAKLEDE